MLFFIYTFGFAILGFLNFYMIANILTNIKIKKMLKKDILYHLKISIKELETALLELNFDDQEYVLAFLNNSYHKSTLPLTIERYKNDYL